MSKIILHVVYFAVFQTLACLKFVNSKTNDNEQIFSDVNVR